jgi:purine/pyrimidine-nucleoside phosphorylase
VRFAERPRLAEGDYTDGHAEAVKQLFRVVNGPRSTVSAVDVGEFDFATDAAERMTVASGELWAKLPAESSWRASPSPPRSRCRFGAGSMKAPTPAADCEFL